jgi:hypothetical protein
MIATDVTATGTGTMTVIGGTGTVTETVAGTTGTVAIASGTALTGLRTA